MMGRPRKEPKETQEAKNSERYQKMKKMRLVELEMLLSKHPSLWDGILDGKA